MDGYFHLSTDGDGSTTIVVTAAFEERSGQLRVTASFDLDRLDQLKALFKSRPHP